MPQPNVNDYSAIRQAYESSRNAQAAFSALADFYRMNYGGDEQSAQDWAQQTLQTWQQQAAGPGQKFTSPLQQQQLRETEVATDPQTAYLRRLGLAGRTDYNPAEEYQANLFRPFQNLWNTQQRLYRPVTGQFRDKGTPATTFMDFLSRVGGGLGGVVGGSESMLRDIFGGTSAQKQRSGYEPGQYLPGGEGEETGRLDPGALDELQQLFRYGLRSQAGPTGARYLAAELPGLQQAYYSQRAGGGPPTTATSFIDWLKQQGGLRF